MRPTLIYGLGLLVVEILMLSARTATAQTTAVGPYYAPPSWDQKLQCDTLATCPRFVVLSNWNSEAVLDRETGLVWERSPSATRRSWLIAQVVCNVLFKGNRLGWRLPTVQELASLIDRTQQIPALPAGHPFTGVESSDNDNYWSATTADFNLRAWSVTFADGEPHFDLLKSLSSFVWCVRGGHGSDPQ